MIPTQILIVGFGCIGQAVLPLLEHAFPSTPILVVDRVLDEARLSIIRRHQLEAIEATVSESNYISLLGSNLLPGGFLLNLAPSVNSCDLIELAQSRSTFYLDSGIEPWAYEEQDWSLVTNQALRFRLLKFARGRENRATALVAHGANPGFVSVLVKEALLRLARKAELLAAIPSGRQEWAQLARALDIRVIQVSEYDNQHAAPPAPYEFANTWSPQGFITECLQDAELGWGSHEPRLPDAAYRQPNAGGAAIALRRPGHRTWVRSWSPTHGPFNARLITHNESISIAEYLTCESPGESAYSPTVYYAYRPTEATSLSMQWLDDRSAHRISTHRLMKDDIEYGMDELGVLLMSSRHGAIWYGSQLDINRARSIAPYNSATSLQVASSITAAMHWILSNPARGVIESDALDHRTILDAAEHAWAPLSAHFTDWSPCMADNSLIFDQFILEQ
jgi:homospermidine synthase